MHYFSYNKHSTTDFPKRWKDDFGGDMYFPMVHQILAAFDSSSWQLRYSSLKMFNKNGPILVLDTHWWLDLLLISNYSANMEKQLVRVLDELTTILTNFENTDNHKVSF